MAEISNPIITAQRLARPQLPRRFYEQAALGPVAEGLAVLLDGRTAKTPGKKVLAVASPRLAEALASEWQAQREVIDPSTMPLTRLVNAALDRVATEMDAVRNDIVKYAMSDLICYRAEGPSELVTAQELAWSPLVNWANDALGVRLRLAAGIVHVEQDETLAGAVATAIAHLPPLLLTALHLATTLTGSAIVALAMLNRRLDGEAAWNTAHVDEDWQMRQWGVDEIAVAARARRRRDFDAAAMVLSE